MRRLVYKLATLIICGYAKPCVADTTWQQQAERLQKISASFLDVVPMGDPSGPGLSVGARGLLSFLPETDPTVGGKTEKVPKSPVHMMPMLQVTTRLLQDAVAVGGWVGVLVPGAERLAGLKASLAQTVYGARFEYRKQTKGMTLFFPLFGQVSQATIEGPISSEDGDDRFTAKSTIMAFTPGVEFGSLWLNMLVGTKNTKSTFEIREDATMLTFTDTLDDSWSPLMYGAAVGYRPEMSLLGFSLKGMLVSVGQLYVPDRLTMPRALLGYHVEFQ